MSLIRVSAVEYLNAKPLVYGLDERPDLFDCRFDVPAKCASLLHGKSVDLGLIPSVEYLRHVDYRIVPDLAVTSTGPVESVALFTDRPATSLRSIAVDANSRTASALLRVLCAKWFEIEPTFVTLRPDLPAMLKRCDAALIIGDAALYQEHELNGLNKVDLGEEWTVMTGLPFVWAYWVGRKGVVNSEHLEALRAARERGLNCLDEIAEKFAPNGDDGESLDIARNYLHESVAYTLDDQARAGLKKFFKAVDDLQIAPFDGAIRYFE
jgi:chorismate dehydratase